MQITIDTERATLVELESTAQLLTRILHDRLPVVPAGTDDTTPNATVLAADMGTNLATGGWPFQNFPVPPSAAATPFNPSGPIPSDTAHSGVPPVPPVTVVFTEAGTPNTGPVLSLTPTATHDKNGMPWDARIHSSSHELNKDGTWRFKRGLDPMVRNTVLTELLAAVTGGVPATPVVPSPSMAVPAPVAPMPPPITAPMPVVPTPPAAPAMPVVPPVGVTFKDVMHKLTSLLTAGKLKPEQVTEACKEAGVAGIDGLPKNPEACARVSAIIDRIALP